MQGVKIVAVIATVIGICGAQETLFRRNWMGNLFHDIDQMRADIETGVRKNVADVNEQVDGIVRENMRHVTTLVGDIRSRIESAGNHTMAIKRGEVINISGNNGSVKQVIASQNEDGSPYYHDIEDTVIDGILHRVEKTYDPTRKTMDVHRYTKDLTKPNAPMIPVTTGTPTNYTSNNSHEAGSDGERA